MTFQIALATVPMPVAPLQSPDAADARLCCSDPVRDSSCESSVVAGGPEQTEILSLQDRELAVLR